MLELLSELQRQLGISYLFITHNLGVVRHIADRVAVLERGSIVDLFSRGVYDRSSSSPSTRKLFDAAPIPDPDQQQAKRAAFESDLPAHTQSDKAGTGQSFKMQQHVEHAARPVIGAGLMAAAIEVDITPDDLSELHPVGGGSFSSVHDPIFMRTLLLVDGPA